ncbi:hypothetical protein FHS40_009008 [Streptomyces spectabilis]|uniref:Uncharacterized protein n=1 Tax=Streptomyces spectabilis TaxID=68270 RepID=A0A7W8B3Z0_STRST|nr:hypothetical protein [Streptomyces spectabilis]
MTVAFPLSGPAGQYSGPWLSGRGDGLAGMVTAKAQVAIVK